MTDRATTIIEKSGGYSPLLSDRAEFDKIYAGSLPLRDIIRTPRQYVMDYYGLPVTFPPLPKEARLAREMIWGFIGIYDENQHIVSLVDFGNEITKAIREKRASVEAVRMVDMRTIHGSPQEQTKLASIFYRKGVEIDQSEFGDIVTFLNQYDKFATTFAQRYFGVANYKALDFKPTYASWKYAQYLNTNKRAQTVKSKYYRLLEAKKTFEGPVLFVASSGNLSFDEMDTLVQDCDDFMFDNNEAALGKRRMMRSLYRKIFDKYFKITENKWAAFSFSDLDADAILQRYQELGNEEINLLMRTFQFAHNELHLIRNDLQKFLARYAFFDTIFDDFLKAFTPNFTSENLNIPPDVFDEIVSAASINGKTAFRKLVHFLLRASGGLDHTPQGYDEERKQFYDRFLDALSTGEITPESSTGDTPIEQARFKNGIDLLCERKDMSKDGLTVLEIGVGTGRIISELSKQFPAMRAFGIDLKDEKFLRARGLPNTVRYKLINIAALTPESLQEAFGLEKVDVIIAPWSLFGDLSEEELQQALKNIKTICRSLIFDVPLVVSQKGSYIMQMHQGANPHTLRVPFKTEVAEVVKSFELRPPERYISACDDINIRLLTIPTDEKEQDEFLAQLRTEKLERTSDIHQAQWITINNKPRITFVGDCEEAHEQA